MAALQFLTLFKGDPTAVEGEAGEHDLLPTVLVVRMRGVLQLVVLVVVMVEHICHEAAACAAATAASASTARSSASAPRRARRIASALS